MFAQKIKKRRENTNSDAKYLYLLDNSDVKELILKELRRGTHINKIIRLLQYYNIVTPNGEKVVKEAIISFNKEKWGDTLLECKYEMSIGLILIALSTIWFFVNCNFVFLILSWWSCLGWGLGLIVIALINITQYLINREKSIQIKAYS